MCIVAVMEKRRPPRSYGSRRGLSRSEIEEGIRLVDDMWYEKPRRRSECGADRPCPYVSCRYHLYLDAKGPSVRLNFPHFEPATMPWSCVLDEVQAFPDGMTLELIGERMNITRERVRQLEGMILEKLRELAVDSAEFQRMIEAWEARRQEGNGDGEFSLGE